LQVIARIVTASPPCLRQASPNIPEVIERLVMRTLERLPEARFESMIAVADALDPLVDSVGDEPEPEEAKAPAPEQSVSTDVAMAATGRNTGRWTAEGGRRILRRNWIAAVVVLAAIAVVAISLLRKPSQPSTTGSAPSLSAPLASAPPSASIQRPELGLRALDDYRAPRGSAVSNLRSESLWNTAATDFEAATNHPGVPVRWTAAVPFCQGQAALNRGDLDAAITSMRRATDLDPHWEGAWVGLSTVLVHRQENAEAMIAAQTAQRIDPGWWVAIAQGARVHTASRRFDDAIQEYRRALALAPDDPVLLAEVALMYHASRMDREAERYARRAIELDPDMTSVRLLLAERALERNDGSVAFEEASRAVAVSPKSASAHLALADALALLRRTEEAFAEYRRAVEITDTMHDLGVPSGRIKIVRQALEKKTLPPARSVKTNRTRPLVIGGEERAIPTGEGDGSRSLPERTDKNDMGPL
jgi:tetratricopeptide (TPR) repeat protein